MLGVFGRLILALGVVSLNMLFGSAAQAQSRIDSVRLAAATNLHTDLREAQASGRVLVVLYATRSCPWCARVRAEHLGPMSRSPEDQKRVLIREIDIESDAQLIDPDGERTTHRGYAQSQGIRFVPVTAFPVANKRSAAESIVGFPAADFFGAYLEQRIAAARPTK